MVDARKQARVLLKRALAGELPVEELHNTWPASDDALLVAIFEETEDTIEHQPGSLTSRSHHKKFRGSVPYNILLVDKQLLLDDFKDVPSQTLLDIRSHVLRKLVLSGHDDSLADRAKQAIEDVISRGGGVRLT